MKRAAAIVGMILVLMAPVQATTYYVAALGSDANNGTSTATPWQTVAKVNAATFSAGDSVLFERGDIFYGTALLVPSSGSNGSPITFGAYSSGANPIVKASTFLNTSGFVLAPNTQTTIFGRVDTGTFSNDSATRNWRDQFPVGEISNPAVRITVSLTASPGNDLNITGSGIGPVSAAPNVSAVTRVTWDGGSSGTTITAGTTKTSDQINYVLDNNVSQIVTVYTTARNVEYYASNGETLWSNFAPPDQSQNPTVTLYQTGGNNVIASIVAINITAYTYTAPLAATPVAVWENGTLMKLVNNPLGVDQNANSWFYDGANLFLHASDGSNVASNGKKYSYVTASSSGHVGWDNGNSWLIFDGVDFAETYNTDSILQTNLGGLILTGANSIVRNLSLHDNFRHDLSIYTGAQNNTVSNITGYNSYGTSPLTIFGAGTSGNLVQKSTFYNDTYLRSAYVFTGAVWTVIVAHGGSTNNTVDSCVIQSTAGGFRLNTNVAHGYGVLVGDTGTTLKLSHSLIYGNFEWGVLVGSGGNSGLGTGANATVFDNLLDASQSFQSASGGYAVFLTGTTGSLVYGNTIYGPQTPGISQTLTSTGALVKNNIFYNSPYVLVDAASEAGTSYDYNDYFGTISATPFSWGGVAYNFANWKTNSGQDSHSVTGNPSLSNPAPLLAGNYTLLGGSPAIDAGVNLGSTYQNALLPAATWPGNVLTGSQSGYGTGWEIGAYLYTAGQVNGTTLKNGAALKTGAQIRP